MDTNDLAFAQACVRALSIVTAAAKEWMRNKTIEFAPKRDEQTDHSQQTPSRD